MRIAQTFSYLFHVPLYCILWTCVTALFHLLSTFIPTALVFLGITTLFIALTSLTSSSYKTPPPEAEGCQCLWAFSIFSLDAVFHHLDSGRLEPLHVVGPPFPHALVLPF